MQNPVVSTWTVTANYNLSPTMFLEATYGQSQNELAGCALAQNNTGPNFCTAAFPMNPIANRNTAGLGGLPYLFPDAVKIQESYYAFRVLNDVAPPIWENGRIQMAPALGWGGRITNAPTNMPFPGYLNINATKDVAISMTKIAGRHTIKMGFYNTHSFKAQQRGGWAGNINFQNDTNNPLDGQFGFANAALGIFSSYQQASAYVEGSFKYDNTEGYIQDNWKLNEKMTLDYGVRLVRQQPQYDTLGQASNFLLDKWVPGQAPQLYIAGCNGAPPPVLVRAGRRRTQITSSDRTRLAIGGSCRSGIRQRPLPVGSGHRRHHLQVAAPRAGAALRHGVRRERKAVVRPARRDGALLRSPERQLDLLAGAESADLQGRDGAVR